MNDARRVMLTADDFDALVRGQEVEREGITLALADIGFRWMRRAVDHAWKDQGSPGYRHGQGGEGDHE